VPGTLVHRLAVVDVEVVIFEIVVSAPLEGGGQGRMIDIVFREFDVVEHICETLMLILHNTRAHGMRTEEILLLLLVEVVLGIVFPCFVVDIRVTPW
jgi:hypothetical protein